MVTRTLPALLALPCMALAVATVAGLSAGLPLSGVEGQSLRSLLFDVVLGKGTTVLVNTMVLTMFGGILSQVVMRQGIAPTIVRTAAEYAGDQKLLLAFLMTAAVALNFATLTGLGAVIMVGTLVLPILVGSGLSGGFAGTLMLFGIAVGGMVNPANLSLYSNLLGLDKQKVEHYASEYALLFAVLIVIYLVVEGGREKGSFAWAQQQALPPKTVPAIALLTPVLPILLILLPGVHWPPMPAFLIAILFGCLTTQPKRVIPNLTAATLEGLRDTAPVLALFMGIGMTYVAMTDPNTTKIVSPLVDAILPSSPLGYIAFFTLLSPLTLYRGPLNLFGLGAGFMVLMAHAGPSEIAGVAHHTLPAIAVMAAFLTVGQVQSVCDPTNTANVWIAQFVRTTTDYFLRRTLLYVIAYVFVALAFAVFGQGVMQ
jgi:DcuC family C4-dicarboxylate transporter